MKKLFYFAAAAVALAACAKNEVIPVNSGENQEITFNVAPKTKADPNPKTEAFSTNNVFASWAYYLPNTEGTSWDKNRTDAKIYIGKEGDAGVTISHDDVNNVWKNSGVSYYWPKDGKLTFFAYSLNRDNLDLVHVSHTHPIYCYNQDNAYGINATIDLKENPNLDLLVADIATDKTQNETFHSINGVPTLFKHKFSRVQFAVKKNENYKDATIKLNSILFKGVVNSGSYWQYYKEDGKSNFTENYYTEGGTRGSAVYIDNSDFEVASATDFVPVTETSETIYIYMPQDFIGVTDEAKVATIKVAYTITYDNGFSENRTRTLNVKDIFERWEMGKKYTFNLIFSLNEITWAPVVEDWEDVKNTTGKEVA